MADVNDARRNKKTLAYTGMTKHWDHDAGYAIWLPSDWRKIDMVEGR
jgi:hypothetical protein